MDYALLFFEGIITFISPCILPMIPIYIMYFAGDKSDTKRTFINALFFVFGFTTIFLLMGFFAGVLRKFIGGHQVLINIITGSIVIIFGLNYLGVFDIGFLNNTSSRKDVKVSGAFSAYLFGLVFSISWTPCVSTFLGAALLTASNRESILQSVLLLLSYSLGMGIPFLLSAILIDRMKTAFDFIKKHYLVINRISGGFLIVIGVLMVTGKMWQFLNYLS